MGVGHYFYSIAQKKKNANHFFDKIQKTLIT